MEKGTSAFFEQIVARMDTSLYVSDFETDELLYANERVRRIMKLSDEDIGKPCWKVMMGLGQRCDFCPKRDMKGIPGEEVSWEGFNNIIKRHLRHTGQTLAWDDGRIAYYQQSVDNTDIKWAEDTAKERLRQQELMMEISKQLIADEDVNIDHTLQELEQFLGCDTVTLFTLDAENHVLRPVHRSRGEGAKLKAGKGKGIPMELGNPIYEQMVLEKKSCVELRGKDLPFVKAAGAASMFFSIVYKGVFLGLLEFTVFNNGFQWRESDHHLGSLAASLLASVLNRQRTSQNISLMSHVIERTNQVVAYFREDGFFTFFNNALCEISGYSRVELEKGGFMLLHTSMDVDRLKKRIIPQMLRQGTVHFDLPMVRKDGRVVWLDYVMFRTQDGMGTIAWDVTYDRMLLKELKTAQERLDVALQSSMAGTWELQIPQRVFTFDDAFAKLMHLTQPSPITLDELADHILLYCVPDEATLKYVDNLRYHFGENPENQFMTIKHRFPDNRQSVYYSTTGKIFQGPDGKPERAVGMTIDVTVAQKTERALQRRLEQQELMSSIAQRFVMNDQAEDVYEETLGEIAGFMQVNSAYIYRYEPMDDCFHLFAYWMGKTAQLDKQSIEKFSRAFVLENHLHLDKQYTICENQSVPMNEKDGTQHRSVMASRMNLPLLVDGMVWGFVGIANIGKPRAWTKNDQNILSLLSGLYITAIGRSMAKRQQDVSDKTLQTVIDGLQQGIFWKDPDTGVFQGCNEGLTYITGRSKADIVGRTAKEIFSEELAEFFISKDKEALAQEGHLAYIQDIPFVHGEARILKTVKSVVKNAQGKAIRVIGTTEDITESQRLEMQIREALRRLEAVMRSYGGAILCIGEDRTIELFGGTSIFGIPNEWAQGRSIYEVYAEYPQVITVIERGFVVSSLTEVIEVGEQIGRCQITPLLDEEGKRNGLLFVGGDVTQQYQMQRQLEEAIVVAEEASLAKSDFLSRMSHEIRTPINAIMGMTRIALGGSDQERKQSCLEKIDAASKNLLDLINQILDMSKIEADKMELVQEPFDLQRLIADVLTVMGVRVEEKGQTLTTELAPEAKWDFVGDAVRISQVLTNLLANAVKFTPENGHIHVQVAVVERVEETTLLSCAITDSGIGIPAEQQERIFNAFEQADGSTSRKYGGTGLGLSICQRIVRLMGGEIHLESEVGQGSTFRFTMRLQNGTSEEVIDPRSEAEGSLEPVALEGKVFLLAEDVEINREIVLSLLEGTGVEMDMAENGTEALETFEKAPERYALIFMDVQMPEMDGYEATQRIRSLPAPWAKAVPIIAMTANAFREDVVKCLEAGMNDHVAKPIDPVELLTKVRKYV